MSETQRQSGEQENKQILSAYIGVGGPETPKYLLANNFLSDFFQTLSEKKMPEISFHRLKEAGILSCEEEQEYEKQLKISFDRFFQHFSGVDAIKSNYKNKKFYFPLHPQMLKSGTFNLRHLLYNMLPDIEQEKKFRWFQTLFLEYLYKETTGVNYLLSELCQAVFQEDYRKAPTPKDPEFTKLFEKKLYRRVCKNFEEDLYCLLTHPFFRKMDFYKKYDYLATLLNTYVIQFIITRDAVSRGSARSYVLCQGSATSHSLIGGAFHRACVQNYARLREVFPREMKQYYLLQMERETDENGLIYLWESEGTVYAGKNQESALKGQEESFRMFANRVFHSHYKKKAESSLFESVKRAFRILEEGKPYRFDKEQFVTFYIEVSQARKGAALTKISSSLSTCGKDLEFIFPKNSSRHKFFAFSPSLLEFYVRLYLARRDRTYAYLDNFLADLEERFSICTQKTEQTDRMLKKMRLKVPFQEFRQNEQALLENLDEINCLVRLSDSGYVITLPEEKGEFRLL
ncbi:MAG: hypothetical protein HFI63_00825 [Lachnospiraceae bacterium]|nr:hypothetical protein [Lachnospiraceae bacterium]